jgi:hypothetical protein
VDADDRLGLFDRLGAAANLHRAGSPRVGAGQVVDDDRSPPAASDVAELLALLELLFDSLKKVAEPETPLAVNKAERN